MASKQLSVQGPVTNTYVLPDGTTEAFETTLFSGDNGSAHLVLNKQGASKDDVHVRMASECTLAQGVGSVVCDCGAQLRKAMHHMGKGERNTMVLYSFGREFEGRGAGPANHFRAYVNHVNKRLSSSEAYRSLGLEVDPRNYKEPIAILKQLGLDKKIFVVLSNNKRKVLPLLEGGLMAVRRGFEAWLTDVNAAQLQSRMEGMAHDFSPEMKTALMEKGIRLKTVDDCLRDGTDMSVNAEQIADKVERYGPVKLPIALHRLDDGHNHESQMYFYVCDGRMYEVVIGAEAAHPEASVAALHACIPGDNFGSLRCGCRSQIMNVMQNLEAAPDRTVFIYALEHHSNDPHAKIPLDSLRNHAFNGSAKRTPMDLDHPDVRVILRSLGVRSERQMII